MLKLENIKQCLWRNIHAPEPVLAGTISFGDAYSWTTDRLSGAVLSMLEERLPVVPRAGVLDAAEMVAYVAQRIQLPNDVADANWGVAARDEVQRRATVFFAAQDLSFATHSLSLAVQIVDRLTRPDITPDRLAKMLESCAVVAGKAGLEPITLEMVRAAMHRGIPWVRLSPLVRHVQLGHGHHQRRIWNTVFSGECALARNYSSNKILTLNTLAQIRLPVGRFAVVKDAAGAKQSAEEIGYPLVLKPIDGMQGDAVFVDLRNEAELTAALASAPVRERPYMLQSFFAGDDHRLLVIAGKLVAAVRKDLPTVTGDGRHTIAELVALVNRDPRRIKGDVMAVIPLNEESDRMLERQGCTRTTIPAAGRVVRINGTANSGSGGISVDVMDVIHPDNAQAAVRASRAIGLNVTGVDFVSPDISKS